MIIRVFFYKKEREGLFLFSLSLSLRSSNLLLTVNLQLNVVKKKMVEPYRLEKTPMFALEKEIHMYEII